MNWLLSRSLRFRVVVFSSLAIGILGGILQRFPGDDHDRGSDFASMARSAGQENDHSGSAEIRPDIETMGLFAEAAAEHNASRLADLAAGLMQVPVPDLLDMAEQVVASNESKRGKMALAGNLAAVLARKAPRAGALIFCDPSRPGHSPPAARVLLRSWGKRQGGDAFAWFDQEGPTSDFWGAAILEGVVSARQPVAAARLLELPPALIPRVAAAIENPEHLKKVLDAVSGSSPSAARDGLIADFACRWGTIGHWEDAMEVFDSLSFENPRCEAAASRLVLASISSRAEYPETIRERVDWFSQRSHSASSVGQIVRKWATVSPDETADWLETIEPGPHRDFGRAALASHLRLTDRERAFSLATAIDEDSLRAKTLSRLLPHPG